MQDPVTSYEILCSDNAYSGFEIVAVVQADGSPGYSGYFLPSHSGEFSVLVVRAVRPSGGATYYHDYCREWHRTGTDVPPATPTGFSAEPVYNGMHLTWDRNTERDFYCYIISWNDSLDFPPDPDPPALPSGEFLEGAYTDSYTHYSWVPGMNLYYRLCAIDDAGNRSGFVIIEVAHETTGDSGTMLPLALTLYQNHPNPFNPSTTISFYLPERCRVKLEIFDVSGRRMTCLADEGMDKGAHALEWNGHDAVGSAAASGVYFCRLTAGKKTIAKKMILLR